MMNQFVTLPRSVVEQALEAFEHLVRRHYRLGTEHDSRAKALRAALEQPQIEQEPVFWYRPRSDGGYEGPINHSAIERVRRLSGTWVPLYTHPQNLSCKSTQKRLTTLWGYVKEQPKREPLTDEQMGKAWAVASGEHNASAAVKRRITRAIERAHGIGGEA